MARHAIRTELRSAAEPIWQAIYRHPFVVENHFVLSSRYECLFWGQAYRLVRWAA